MAAAEEARTECVRVLLEAGADIHAADHVRCRVGWLLPRQCWPRGIFLVSIFEACHQVWPFLFCQNFVFFVCYPERKHCIEVGRQAWANILRAYDGGMAGDGAAKAVTRQETLPFVFDVCMRVNMRM